MREQQTHNPTGMVGVVELITPEKAKQYLATMPAGNLQRTLRKHRLHEYAQSRINNEWRLHHQGIAFDVDGRLRDGQHRLNMIVDTGLPTALFVVRNVPLDSFIHVDEQLPRSTKDALRMADRGDFTNAQISVARVITSYPQSDGDITYRPTKEQIINRLRLWAKEIAFACEATSSAVGVTRSPKCLLARAAAAVPPDMFERLTLWRDILCSGLAKNPATDSAAISYRNHLLGHSGRSSGRIAELEKYRKGQSALDYFLKYKPLGKLYGTELDLFPVPERLREDV